ncbi:histidyl-tRNA synthetase [Lepidopterella palustris CBS 459.81]|uniref:Histidine--tRNA ligase, mitochondrial n=1 Tax=Lepidopterella palustris CBS 459.81 TaxID=1314670 RepID=A0A8E2JAK1_9PEZI|nr:histidyl-tRNA synthetase [Lepidopterella palustris CBS 459.81]
MSKSGKAKTSFQLKTPKGTKDWDGTDVSLRDQIFSTITEVFKRHGAITIDTPVFELKEILSGKYGEDSKLIYDLADQGGELCSLRYDLTVPFARYLAMNSIQSIKRYHIAKVYRRDQPAMSKGRLREFYQCDYDIAGVYDPMVPDAEVLRLTTEIFEALGWERRYTIKINHRKILDGIFEVCGVPEDKLRMISSAVDKLDKLPWEEVKKEMTEEKGLAPEVADEIGKYVKLKGGQDILTQLKNDSTLYSNEHLKNGVDSMQLLFDYLQVFGVMDSISFDLSLARGLDYYTGVIYEVITEESGAGGVGSIAAGGRYDELVGMFSGKSQIPCVGISFGLERIFSVIKARLNSGSAKSVQPKHVDVYVMAFGGKDFTGLLPERMRVAAELWDAGIKAEFSYKKKPRLPQQFKAAEGVPFGIILGDDELAAGKVRIKQLGLPEGHAEKDGVLVNKEDIVAEIKQRLETLEDKSLAAQLGAVKV